MFRWSQLQYFLMPSVHATISWRRTHGVCNAGERDNKSLLPGTYVLLKWNNLFTNEKGDTHMDFLEDLFENFGRKRHHSDSRKGHHRGNSHQDEVHRDCDHYGDGHLSRPNNTFLSCPRCSQKITTSYNFCPNCGLPSTRSLLCSSCNKEVPPQSKFCPSCGAKAA